MGADCKSVGGSLHRFESCTCHQRCCGPQLAPQSCPAAELWHAQGMTEPQFGGIEDGMPPPYYPPPGLYPPPGPYPAWLPRFRGTLRSASADRRAAVRQVQGDGRVAATARSSRITGIGRIYLGYTGLGVAQLIVGLATCGIGAVIWGIVDAVLILTDKVRDPAGAPA